ncbi:MAG: trehalose-phosphatase [Desulfobacterales bacterium]|nr:trehalose-phosphatase [Desulfobacterales bacterium]MDD4071778.1 trehalose-phosphatase [Desulfobacterales bacterium]MDD4393665.1 trehalose-phosphatase [Desulfobacterales bacterium]
MKIFDKEKKVSVFFESMRNAAGRALLLDYDGTLAPFRINRGDARPYPGITGMLEKIIGAGKTRLVVISGRGLDDLIPLLGTRQLPELWGSHGGERLSLNGTYETAVVPERLKHDLQRVSGWLLEKGWGRLLEKKPLSLAVHWRGLNERDIAGIRMALKTRLPDLVNGAVLTLHEFDGGLEFRPSGISKAQAVDRILGEMPSGTAAAYLGDDLTDEDAFSAIKGRGLAVLVRETLRDTCADLWLRPPDELLDFLRRWQAATS